MCCVDRNSKEKTAVSHLPGRLDVDEHVEQRGHDLEAVGVRGEELRGD